ncbi:hypothetical protein LR48_Vigan11g043100 [Vigna angularis]|uniref:Uncharacterized protein n=1 Tax=Phaseolus angularis TaxID=3914 RepID=A0A0L9VR12_PHAAN|nr:hypothetical protein LR48_Vigan11g043100 [Vigna angularis]
MRNRGEASNAVVLAENMEASEMLAAALTRSCFTVEAIAAETWRTYDLDGDLAGDSRIWVVVVARREWHGGGKVAREVMSRSEMEVVKMNGGRASWQRELAMVLSVNKGGCPARGGDERWPEATAT